MSRKHSLLSRLTLSGLALGLTAGLTPSLLLGGEGAFGDPATNRGDNPVVGSLPCQVSPLVDLAFWLPLGKTAPGPGVVANIPAMMGVIGPPEMEDVLFDAMGTPYGGVNAFSSYTGFALANPGKAILYRNKAASGEVTLWQHVPDGYIGGMVEVVSSTGTTNHPIHSNLFPLPLADIANTPDTVGLTQLRIFPGRNNTALGIKTITFLVAASTVSVDYVP